MDTFAMMLLAALLIVFATGIAHLARVRSRMECLMCGVAGALYPHEPAPGIWTMECAECGAVYDRHGRLH